MKHTQATAATTTLKRVTLTENQFKVIKDKYLRDAPSVEAWLEGVASNIALAELLYLGKEKEIFQGIDVFLRDVDVGGERSRMILLHHNKTLSDQRRKNFDVFIKNLYHFAATDPACRKVHHQAKERFYNLLANFEFLPNSPTLMNAGRELQQLSACYVLPIEDSIEGWMDTLKNAAIIHKSGGGTGFSGCHVRPRGSEVRSSRGVASGALSPFNLIDAMTAQIRQGGTRRGANMGILPYNHPDILEFIEAKRTPGVLENFNISVAITEEFMRLVDKNADYDLINPRTHQKMGTLNARKMWDRLVRSAWETGDPGLIMIDRINNTDSNPTPHIGQIESTNPCVTGDSLIATEHGLIRMKELVKTYGDGGIKIATDSRVPLEIQNQDGTVQILQKKQTGISFDTITKAFSTGIKDVYTITTQSGYELTATADHKVLARYDTYTDWVSVSKLNPELHTILIQSGEGRFSDNYDLPFDIKNNIVGKNRKKYILNLPSRWSKELGQLLGWLVGDGWLRDGDKNCRVGFTFGKDDIEIMDYLKPIINGFYGAPISEVIRRDGTFHLSYHSKYFVEFFRKLGILPADAAEKVVPESVFTAPKEVVIGFLQGLFSSDGTVSAQENNGMYYTRLTSKSKKLLQQVQLLLLNLGIKSRIYNRSRKERRHLFEYTTKGGQVKHYASDGLCYELHVGKDNIPRFLRQIGFIGNKHTRKITCLQTKEYYADIFEENITSLTYAGKREVYDLTEPRTLSFITNGMLSLDCGEQPLLPYEPCNLGSINLSKFVDRQKNDMDWERLKECVHTCVRFLDNVIDVNNYPLPEIEIISKGNRRIGLGVMGWAETLVLLGLPYNTHEAFAKAERVMKFINDEALHASEDLGKERGVFPNWKNSIFDPEGTFFRGKAARPRHCARTTIAPTGTIGITAGLQGAGIEPFFAIVYTRYNAKAIDAVKKGEQPHDADVFYEINPLFQKIAEEHKYFGLEPTELWNKVEHNHKSLVGIEEIPEKIQQLFLTSHDLTPEDHVRMQAAFQRHTNNAVSKTINFNHEATIGDVDHAYKLAFSLGCKGITIYRDGSKSTQVLNLTPAQITPQKDIPPPQKEVEMVPEVMMQAVMMKTTAVPQQQLSKQEIMQSGACPECKSTLTIGEGCFTCMSCGFSACSV